MKKLMSMIALMVAGSAYAADSVTVRTNGTVSFPTNFVTANSLVTQANLSAATNAVSVEIASNTARIVVLETGKLSVVNFSSYTNSTAGSLNTLSTGKLDVTTFSAHSVSNDASVTLLTTGKVDQTDFDAFVLSSTGSVYTIVTGKVDKVDYNAEVLVLEGDITTLDTGKLDIADFSSFTNSQSATNQSLQAQIDVASSGLTRYHVLDSINKDIWVTATASGITATFVGSTVTFDIPIGVIPVAASIRVPAGTGTTLTMNMGTNWCANTGWEDRWNMTAAVYREDTGAQIPSATLKLSPTTFSEGEIIGLNNSVVTRIAVSFQ